MNEFQIIMHDINTVLKYNVAIAAVCAFPMFVMVYSICTIWKSIKK